ncbi:MAG TPA: sensor histidine kinase, partial [Candidatus Agrococcus pullicola]|nr:sensor histidine kinase [Candidatus Agrococcus pullicola]
MTSTPAPFEAPLPRVHSPLRLAGAIAHLAFIGLYGTAVFTILLVLVSVGIPGLALLGTGALLL